MARIIIPPRGVGVGITGKADGKYLAYVESAVYVNTKKANVELPEIVFYEAGENENSNQIRAALESKVRAAFSAAATTPVLWMNI